MKVLVAPLDWGLGHATRCIPVISELIKQGDEVVIAADGNAGELLKLEFPGLLFIPFQGYRMKYSARIPMAIAMLVQVPKMIARIIIEHRQLKGIIRKHKIEKIISDNRYGLWNKKIHSIFITHQVMVKFPAGLKFLEPILYSVIKKCINNYDECWIPDDEKKISGDLSNRYALPGNAKYIGLLSRWSHLKSSSSDKVYDLVAIVSGPEPHRTTFEKLLISKLASLNLNSLIVQGKPALSGTKQIKAGLTVVPHLKNQELFDVVSSAKWIICRAGYSSIMDLTAIQKDAILIPTPGQTEQIYLAEYLHRRKIFLSMNQENFQPEAAIRESQNYSVENFDLTKN